MAEGSSNLENSSTVVCPRSILEALCSAVLESFTSRRHGGEEVCGALVGTRRGDEVRIEEFHVIAFQSPMAGAMPLLSDERNLFARALATNAERHLVGWFRSHPHSELGLTQRDVEVGNTYFPHRHQIFLVLRPSNSQPSLVRFFSRGSDGSLKASGPFDEFAFERAAAGVSASRDAQAGRPHPAVPTPPNPVHMYAPAQPLSDRRRTPPAWPLALVVVIASLAVWYWRSSPPQRLGLNVLDRSGQLLITWDPVPDGQAGHLEISDGGAPLSVDLGTEQLHKGSFSYARHSHDVNIRLAVSRRGALPLTEITRFVGSPEPTKGSPPAEAAPQNLTPLEPKVGELVVPVPVTPAAAAQPLKTTVAPLPPTQSRAPVIRTPQTTPASPVGSNSGRVMWIGHLQQYRDVVINGKYSSSGRLIGGLPGKPVKFTVSPGEISRSGIVLYTANGQYGNRTVESPAAANAWHRTTYTWNPDRANDVKVEQGPGPGNLWNRLVMRSANPRISVVVIDWELVN
jgi:proteasome lid subunit RPN8/RPN11